MVITELRRVCHIHYGIYTASPIEEPESFFDLLGLDPSRPPFSDPDWLKSSERVHLEAVDLILEHWVERKNRILKDEQASEREYHLDQASAALMKIPTAKAYMTIVMPSIRHKRGFPASWKFIEKRALMLKKTADKARDDSVKAMQQVEPG
ncbi:hypothetical protein CEP54_014060 [Fusarium duplospermum]|uniref:Uncharacterized protein n=1 Tax=Fusarium duplospermum TaxID=1325734 RepID=A0A428NYS7_9HYPO|nr:hypothetical protein CEP54_014060 [Fusarium duplospermum]